MSVSPSSLEVLIPWEASYEGKKCGSLSFSGEKLLSKHTKSLKKKKFVHERRTAQGEENFLGKSSPRSRLFKTQDSR